MRAFCFAIKVKAVWGYKRKNEAIECLRRKCKFDVLWDN